MPVDQAQLEDNLKLFLEALGESYPTFAEEGICNGFAFMNFRADLLGERDKNIKRMQRIALYSDEEIQKMAKLYQEYKNSLILSQKKHEQIDSKENKPKQFTDNEKIYIQCGEELYYYTHSLLAAFDPGAYLGLRSDDEPVNQSAFIQIIKLIDDKKFADEIENVFDISFVFKEEELRKLFTDTNIMRSGDFITVCSSNHAIYLSYNNGEWMLYDPEPLKIASDNVDIVALLKERFFTIDGHSTEHMPIEISIFEKRSAKKQSDTRPDAIDLLKNMLAKRKESDKAINQQAWDKTTALHMAARSGRVSIANMLIESKADLNTVDNNGWTATIFAAQNDYVNVIQVLAEAKADLNTANDKGMTPIYMATQHCNLATVNELIKRKVKLDEPAQETIKILLDDAVSKNCKATVEALFQRRGIDITQQDTLSGFTPFHAAVFYGYKEIVKALIAAGVDIDKRTDDGISALDFARAMQHGDIIEILQNAYKSKMEDKLSESSYSSSNSVLFPSSSQSSSSSESPPVKTPPSKSKPG